MAPAAKMTSCPSTLKLSSPETPWIPTARLPSKTTRWAWESDRIVRLGLSLAESKYPMAVLHRTRSTVLKGVGPTPVESGLL